MSAKDEFSDSEDDLEMDDAVSPETLQAIATLRASLEANPNQYEQHTQIIVLLKGAVMLEELRAAREAMSSAYPLSEELWLEWIGDETNLATSEDEKKHVLELYGRATSDYLSINIWKSYVDYAIQEYTESAEHPDSEVVVSKEYMRRLFKRADKFTGHHVPLSHTIWNVWRDFELEQLTLQDPPLPDDVSRVKAMHMDRIAVPHTELDDTFSSLSSFITQYDGQAYEQTMVQSNSIVSITRKQLSEVEQFEQQLVASNSLEAFTSYLDYMIQKHRDHFALIRTLFERAAAVHCLVPAVWNDYVTFLMSVSHKMKGHDLDPSEVLSVATRSVRNCPWSGDLWENRFVLMETYLKPEEEINVVLSSALGDVTLLATPQELSKVLLARCSYKFRQASKSEDGHNQVREAFEHALTVIDAAGGDPYCRIERLWIELEWNVYGDHEKARKLWKTIEAKQDRMADFWIAQADMERQLKNIKGARQIYVRAWHAAQTMDWPEKIFEAWLAFERESGDVAAYKDALTRSRAAMKSVEVYRATQVESVYSEQVAYDVPKPAATVEVATKKRKLSFQDNVQASKITKTDEEQNAQKQNQASINPRPLDISSGRHSDTCFVANFPANMTEKRLKELFQEYGTILRCTIPSRNTEKGKRRFAYVQFSSADEANAALRLDGRDVGDRLGLSVRISDTSKKTRSTSGPPLPRVSRHEVHVSGITNELKEEELKKLVSLHAQPTSVFIMRNSSSKGKIWANVKFDTEEDADAALALNGTMFHGKQLTVTRRVFQQKESDENQSRRERRKALQKKEEGEESKHEEPEAEVATSSTTGTTNPPANIGEEAPEPSEQDKSEEPDASSSSKLDEAKYCPLFSCWIYYFILKLIISVIVFRFVLLFLRRKPVATLTSMQPRSMLSRNKPKPKKPNTHLKPPTRAFRSASAIAAGALSSLTQVDGGEAASESKGEATAPAAPVAPKSNAEFRALMLSGALKKKNP
ncbi:hypothetical protein EDD21DRAFT_30438 [Dissophora ornata]|nr:hypothetical protein EDD21DRAFT_30438 [Dissophora ornata]